MIPLEFCFPKQVFSKPINFAAENQEEIESKSSDKGT
jgi:hypothetical protein